MGVWPLFLPDLTVWYNWHAGRHTLPGKWEGKGLPAICRDMGVPAWRTVKPWRVEIPGVEGGTEKTETERTVRWETRAGILLSRWTRGPDGDWWQAEYPVKSAADLAAAREAAEARRYVPDPAALAAERSTGDPVFLALELPQRPWSELFHSFLGWSEGLMLFLEQEEALRGIVGILEEKLQDITREVAKMPGDLVLSPDNLDGQFIAPSSFDEHLAPSYERSAEALHAAGKRIVVHAGGPVRGLLPGLARCGVDCVEGVCGPPQGDASLAEAREMCGASITLWGGIAQDFLLGSRAPQEFETAVTAAFDQARGDPNAVVGVADKVPVDALPERLEALLRFAREAPPR